MNLAAAFSVVLLTLAVVTTRGEQQLDECFKWRQNYLDLGTNQNLFVQLQPDCYEFSYTTITSTTGVSPLQPVTLRVAHGCGYDSTTSTNNTSVEYAPALRTLGDFYDYASLMCVPPCPEDPTIATACQVTYTEQYASFSDPVTGTLGGVMPYQIPEWINVTMNDSMGFYISNFTALDCVAENMITENSVSNNCTAGSDGSLVVPPENVETTPPGDGNLQLPLDAETPLPPDNPNEMPSGEVCHNWQNTALGLLMAKASWSSWQPNCYQFTYTRSNSYSEPIEETHRVAYGTAVDVIPAGEQASQNSSSAWPAVSTLSEWYEYAAVTCGTETCPTAGPYECRATYTTDYASTANEANGWFGAIFSYEIPQSLYIDRHHGIANDNVMYRVTAYSGLDCEAEGMVAQTNSAATTNVPPDDAPEIEPLDDVPPPLDEPADDVPPDDDDDEPAQAQSVPVVCHNWQNTALALLTAKASWSQWQPNCYEFTYTRSSSSSLADSIEVTHRVVNGTAVDATPPSQAQEDSSIWPAMATITDLYEFAVQNCTDSCPQAGAYECNITYTTHQTSTANEANGWFGAIFSFEVPESIHVDLHHGMGNDTVTYSITSYTQLDCAAEGMIKEVGDANGTSDANLANVPSSQVCHNWQNTGLALLTAKASWIQWQPECYQFTYSRSSSSAEPIEVTHRVAYGSAVDQTPPQQVEDSAIWPPVSTITELYDFAVQNCTDSCPEAGAYECNVTFTTYETSTANEANGWFGAIFSFFVPETIYVDLHHGVDDVMYHITDYRGLDCAAEGMVNGSGGNVSSVPEVNVTSDVPEPAFSLFVKCENWEEMQKVLQDAKQVWLSSGERCYGYTIELEDSLDGPWQVQVDSEVVTVVEGTLEANMAFTFDDWFLILEERCFSDCPAGNSHTAYKCSAVFDESGGYPLRMEIHQYQGDEDTKEVYIVSSFASIQCATPVAATPVQGVEGGSNQADKTVTALEASSTAPPIAKSAALMLSAAAALLFG